MAGRVLIKIVYQLARRILGLAVLVFRKDLAKDAELLVLRHENAVLRRHVGRVRYEPADRVWFTALARLLPRSRWAEIYPVTAATLLAWHRKLAAKKYDTSNRRRPGRPPTVRSIARRPPVRPVISHRDLGIVHVSRVAPAVIRIESDAYRRPHRPATSADARHRRAPAEEAASRKSRLG